MNIKTPKNNEPLDAAHKSDDTLQFLAQRRSGMVKSMGAPGPDAKTRDLILQIAARVPDHRKLFPWRFLMFEGTSRADFGEHLAEKFKSDCPNMDAARVQFERERFLRAPLVVGVVSSPQDCVRGTPVWEQELSAGAVCYNMLLAARASGFAAQWLTEWYAFDTHINKVLGLKKSERMAGFIYIGTAQGQSLERSRPKISDIAIKWQNTPI